MRWVYGAIAVIVAMAGVVSAQNAARFEMVAGSSETAKLLQALRQEIEQGKVLEAASRVEELLGRHADELAADDEGGVISVAAGVDAVLTKAVADEYGRLVEPRARKELESLRDDTTAGYEKYYMLGRQYRAAAALVEAGDRAAINGDASAAACFYGLAKRYGWAADSQRTSTWAICRMLDGETGGNLLAEAGKGGVELAVRLAGYRGPAIFDAPWYGKNEAVGLARFFPVACDGVIYFAGARHVLAIRESGQVLWRWTSGENWTRGPVTDRGSARGRGPNYQCAVFSGAAGAQIVAVRQPRGVTEDFCLRAIRASDGKLLWTTETIREFNRLSFAGSPAIAGRFVYAIAVDFEDQAKLVLVGVDLLDGRLLFKTALGNMLDLKRAREERLLGWDDFWEQSEPAVSGAAVYVTPNVGVAFCVGRFDGKLRWERIYEAKSGAKVWRGNEPASRVNVQARLPRPTDPNELLRWRGTPAICGDVVVIAPQDSPAMWGLAAATGKVLWAEKAAPEWCLVGKSEMVAIFAGFGVSAVDAATGKVKWRYEPMGGAKISGPVIVAGGAVYVPTADGRVVAVSAENGKVTVGKVKVPGVRQITSSPTAKRDLEEAAILEAGK